MAASCAKDMTCLSVVLCSYSRLTRRNIFKHVCSKVEYSTAALSTVEKHQTTIDDSLDVNSSSFKHRRHPGVLKCRRIQLPIRLQESVSVLLAKYPVHQLKDQTQFLVNYLASRKRPMEDAELRKQAIKLENELVANSNDDLPERPKELRKRKTTVMNKLKKSVYHWQPIIYNEMVSVAYLLGRIAPNYAAIYRVFNEIKMREPEFRPEAILDFGSGLGTSVWATEATWNSSVNEYLCIDLSKSMHTVADALLRDGDEDKERCTKNVFQRHFVPLSPQHKYNITMSAFSLLDLPTKPDRLNTIRTLWRKTDDFMLIIENGSREGFETVNEARDLILGNEKHSGKDKEVDLDEGYVFAPCQHDLSCPRMMSTNTTVPCNCIQEYQPLKELKIKSATLKERFSYLILRKGIRKNRADSHWPRIVEPVLQRSRHVICSLCCPNGQLERPTITAAKHGKDLYRCTRHSHHGDLLPISQLEALDHLSTSTNEHQESNDL